MDLLCLPCVEGMCGPLVTEHMCTCQNEQVGFLFSFLTELDEEQFKSS